MQVHIEDRASPVEMVVSAAIWGTSVVAALPLLCVIANAAVHGDLPELPQNCQDRLSLIFTSYYSDESPANVNCSAEIRSALNDGGSNCPSEDILQSCFQRARKTWVKFAQDCELFSAPPLCKGVQGECQKPGYAPPPSAGAAPVHRARAESEGEGEGSRGRRLASAAGYRRLFAEGEGEGEGSCVQSFGCFPDFYYPQDFDDWIQDHFKEPLYSAHSKISPVGIVLWIVHSLGILSLAFL